MIHLGALPGTPSAEATVDSILEAACAEALAYRDAGFDGLIVENMHDLPYLRRDAVGPEIVAAMAVITREVQRVCGLATGVQILAGANRQALAVAQSAGAGFIRAEGFVFGHVADEGWIDSDAGELLRYRRRIGADAIGVFVDIKKKHSSHAVTADISLAACAEAAQFFGADGLVVTGSATGMPATMNDVRAVAEVAGDTLVSVGSGVTADNVRELFEWADAAIVGSFIKRGGDWRQPLDHSRLDRLVSAAKG